MELRWETNWLAGETDDWPLGRRSLSEWVTWTTNSCDEAGGRRKHEKDPISCELVPSNQVSVRLSIWSVMIVGSSSTPTLANTTKEYSKSIPGDQFQGTHLIAGCFCSSSSFLPFHAPFRNPPLVPGDTVPGSDWRLVGRSFRSWWMLSLCVPLDIRFGSESVVPLVDDLCIQCSEPASGWREIFSRVIDCDLYSGEQWSWCD